MVLVIAPMRYEILATVTGCALDALRALLRPLLKFAWERSLKISMVADAKAPVGVATHWGSEGQVIIKTRTGTSKTPVGA